MSWLISPWPDLAIVATKAILMYATALVCLRLAQRRTLAQWTIIDFAAAVATGAIVGRTALAQNQSYAAGVVALVAIIVAHRLASLLRFRPVLGKLADYRIRVLVDGEIRRDQLRLCGLTDNDLYAELRQRGVFDIGSLKYVLYEAKGGLTVVPRTATSSALVAEALRDSTGYPEAPSAPPSDRTGPET
jgi:uncharacterized membrane protein YcaP (DUF421 family)